MKKFVFIFVALCLFSTACEKQEVQLTPVDMSNEEPGTYYTYFRFINTTGNTICIEAVEYYSDIGTYFQIENGDDGVARLGQSSKGFKSIVEIFPGLKVYYNYDEGRKNNYEMRYSDPNATGSPYNILSWSDEKVDDNSLIRTFTFTKKHAEEAKNSSK